MQRIIFILTILLLSANWVQAKHLHTEKEYQTYWCNAHHGQMEVVYKTKNGVSRVDCLTDKYAVEVDFASKQHQCHGQAMEYSALTGKYAMCLLIVETPKDIKYVNKLRSTRDKKKIPLRVWTITKEQFERNL